MLNSYIELIVKSNDELEKKSSNELLRNKLKDIPEQLNISLLKETVTNEEAEIKEEALEQENEGQEEENEEKEEK